MQILITHSRVAKTQVLHFSRWQLFALGTLLALGLVLLSGAIYSLVVLKAARENWPVVGAIVRPLVQSEFAQRDRYMRENLDAMAGKVGEMQAKLFKLETLGERVASQAGVKPSELKPSGVKESDKPAGRKGAAVKAEGGQGGPYIPANAPSLQALNQSIETLEAATETQFDVFKLAEARLMEGRLARLMMPSQAPVDVRIGSGFGFRSDPFSGRPALHAGLDFPADVGTPIVAAAGGMVIATENHATYGLMVEVDHNNQLVTRYAHASKVLVRVGDVVKRGQVIAHVGNTGRSTGPHLHFEVLVDGVQQDPGRFLAAAKP